MDINGLAIKIIMFVTLDILSYRSPAFNIPCDISFTPLVQLMGRGNQPPISNCIGNRKYMYINLCDKANTYSMFGD